MTNNYKNKACLQQIINTLCILISNLFNRISSELQLENIILPDYLKMFNNTSMIDEINSVKQ